MYRYHRGQRISRRFLKCFEKRKDAPFPAARPRPSIEPSARNTTVRQKPTAATVARSVVGSSYAAAYGLATDGHRCRRKIDGVVRLACHRHRRVTRATVVSHRCGGTTRHPTLETTEHGASRDRSLGVTREYVLLFRARHRAPLLYSCAGRISSVWRTRKEARSRRDGSEIRIELND